MLIDFHTHSTASDGELSPQELLEQARRSGIEIFAITDHDTVAGYRSALAHLSIDDALQL
ncbi:MAG: PHP domain-containing protein, partial [Halioglobus sp.]